jgi:hypothetical protein
MISAEMLELCSQKKMLELCSAITQAFFHFSNAVLSNSNNRNNV